MKNIKVGIDAFNDLAKSHDAHVKEVERLQKELDELNNLKLVDQTGELLLECKIGDEYHQLLLEVGLNTILEKFIKDIGKVWYGDLNITEDYLILKSIADSLNTTLYVLWEMDARFGKEKKPIDELIKKAAWNTTEVKPTKDWYLSVKMKEKK